MKTDLRKKRIYAIVIFVFTASLLCALSFAVFKITSFQTFAAAAESLPQNEIVLPDGKIISDSADEGITLFFNNGNLFAQWAPVNGADCYSAELNGVLFCETSVATIIDLSAVLNCGGKFTLRISAVSDAGSIGSLSCAFRRFMTLKPPSYVSICENTLVWDASPNATCYSVFINGKEYNNVRTESFSLDGILTEGEAYEFKIRAYNDSANAEYYAPSSAAVFGHTEPLFLSKPENAFAAAVGSEIYLSFTPVTRAERYLITVSEATESGMKISAELETASPLIDMTNYLNDGDYVISITAVCGSFKSDQAKIAFRVSDGILELKGAAV